METIKVKPRDEIIERIECYILENGLKADDRLPSERELCNLWNCNRMTLRSAIQRLIAAGTLYNIPSKGSFVAREKLERYLQDLTSFSDFVMSKGYPIRNEIISQTTLLADKKISKYLQIPFESPVFELARLRVVDERPISIEWAYLPLTRFPKIDQYHFERLSLYAVLEMKYLVELEGGKEEISITYAEEDEAEWLKINPGDALFFLRGVTWDEQHIPVEYIKSVIRPDRMRFAGKLLREEIK